MTGLRVQIIEEAQSSFFGLIGLKSHSEALCSADVDSCSSQGGASGGAPVVTISLPRRSGTEMIDFELPGLQAWNPVPLAPLHDKWLSTEVEITLGAGEGRIQLHTGHGDIRIRTAVLV